MTPQNRDRDAFRRRACPRWLLPAVILFIAGCIPGKRAEPITGLHVSVLTYNVNWGMPAPELAVKAITEADADLLCLQETTPAWEQYLRPRLESKYPYIRFCHYRGAGGLAVLSKMPLKEIAYVPSKVGWFPGWILEGETPIGPIQILNVHLHPAVGERGSVGPGPYFSTPKLRLREIQEFHKYVKPPSISTSARPPSSADKAA